MALVVDNSVVLAWCLSDESHPLADAAILAVVEHGGIVPGIWWYELRNALIVNERRGRLDSNDTRATLADIGEIGITMDREHDEGMVLELARRHGLTVYDAAYVEVALRRRAALATLDDKLRQATTEAGADVFEGL